MYILFVRFVGSCSFPSLVQFISLSRYRVSFTLSACVSNRHFIGVKTLKIHVVLHVQHTEALIICMLIHITIHINIYIDSENMIGIECVYINVIYRNVQRSENVILVPLILIKIWKHADFFATFGFPSPFLSFSLCVPLHLTLIFSSQKLFTHFQPFHIL